MFAAVELAHYGRHFTPLESELRAYLLKIDSGKRFGLKKPIPLQAACRLSKLFLEAVRNRDGKVLRDMARALDNFQPDSPPVDQLRKDILILKGRLEHRGETMTFKEACIALNVRVGVPAIDKAIQNGDITDCTPCLKIPDSTLRHYFKTLQFPLAKDKTGRPKNSAK